MKNYYTQLLVILAICGSFSVRAQYTKGLTLMHDGETRTYDLYVPPNYSSSENLPLVLNMHGFGATSEIQAAYSQFNQIADTARFIVVYPQGLVRTIDTGQTAEHWNAYFGTNVDDKGFLLKLIDNIVASYSIDESRIYAIGYSNGGYMAYRLACEASSRMAAVASVTGTMVFAQLPNCAPNNRVSVLHIHGTLDETVSYNGSARSVAVPEVISTWLDINNCQVDGVTEENLPDLVESDNSTVSRYRYDNCTLNTDVHLYKVNGGGHTWPGAPNERPELGSTNHDIKASAVIWNFLKTHRNANVVTSGEDELKDEAYVYPAIFEDRVEVNRIPAGSQMSLYSYDGKLMIRKQDSSESETLLTHDLPAGVYVLHVTYPDNGYKSFRLVKTR